MSVPIIGLHGRMGSGKDTVLERLQVLMPDKFVRVSFADPLKRSVAVLFGITVEQLEHLKRDDGYGVGLGPRSPGVIHTSVRDMTIRTFLQRYGTEAHREIFGDDFWVEVGMREAMRILDASDYKHIVVFTDVRFENEARAIIKYAGEIWEINGPVNDTGDHASETPLPAPFIDRYIDNTSRRMVESLDIHGFRKSETDFSALDAQLKSILDELSVESPNEKNPDRPHTDDRATGNERAGS